jgi:hypothetical protein
MPKRLSIPAHLRVDALATHYRRAKDPVARSHWQVIWQLAPGLPSAPVAAVTGDSGNWTRTMARRYNQQGRAGREGRRHRNPGATGLLSPAQRAALAAALTPPHPLAVCGQGRRRRPGWARCWAMRSIPSAGGRPCGAWAGPRRSHGLATPTPIPRRTPLLKKPPGRSPCPAAGIPRVGSWQRRPAAWNCPNCSWVSQVGHPGPRGRSSPWSSASLKACAQLRMVSSSQYSHWAVSGQLLPAMSRRTLWYADWLKTLLSVRKRDRKFPVLAAVRPAKATGVAQSYSPV